MLFASCSFCYTGGHFRSTRANADVICAHDHYTVSFRGRRKKARDERRRDDKEGRGIGQRLSMGERASCRDEKDELKCERARAQRRMMIDRLFRGLEFDFSFRRRENTYGTVLRFCISLFFSFGFFFSFFSYSVLFLPGKVDARFSDYVQRPILSYPWLLVIFQTHVRSRLKDVIGKKMLGAASPSSELSRLWTTRRFLDGIHSKK